MKSLSHFFQSITAFGIFCFTSESLADNPSWEKILSKVTLVLNESQQSLCPSGKLDLSQGFRLYSDGDFPGAQFDISFSLVNWEIQGEGHSLIQEYPAPAYNPQGGQVQKNCATRHIASYVNESSEELSVLSQGYYLCSDRSSMPVTSSLYIAKKGSVIEVEVVKANGPANITCKYSAPLP